MFVFYGTEHVSLCRDTDMFNYISAFHIGNQYIFKQKKNVELLR
jgi:hypothetical protein